MYFLHANMDNHFLAWNNTFIELQKVEINMVVKIGNRQELRFKIRIGT